jgi:hypothetical protein
LSHFHNSSPPLHLALGAVRDDTRRGFGLGWFAFLLEFLQKFQPVSLKRSDANFTGVGLGRNFEPIGFSLPKKWREFFITIKINFNSRTFARKTTEVLGQVS